MERAYCVHLAELKREKRFLERKLKVKMRITGRTVIIEGEPLAEFSAVLIIDAINLGFSAAVASLIIDEDFVFEKINIKSFTRRKDLDIIRGRLIGTHGRTKNTLEQISGCNIKIKKNDIGIIGPASEIQYAITAVTNIIKGSKQANAYKYLERVNTKKKRKKKPDS